MQTREDMVCGGYLAARVGTAGVLSACNHIADIAPMTAWVDNWEEEALAFGVPHNKLEQAKNWLDKRQESVLPWHIATTPDIPRAFLREFDGTASGMVIGVSIRKQRANEIIGELPDGGSGYGLFQMLQRAEPAAEGGECLGFEVLSTSFYGIDHSWFCYGFPLVKLPNSRPDLSSFGLTSFGLIPSEADAIRARDDARDTADSPPRWRVGCLVADPPLSPFLLGIIHTSELCGHQKHRRGLSWPTAEM